MPHHRKNKGGGKDSEPTYNRPRSKLVDFLFAGFIGIVAVLIVVWLVNWLFYR